jgi:hypothetical protein
VRRGLRRRQLAVHNISKQDDDRERNCKNLCPVLGFSILLLYPEHAYTLATSQPLRQHSRTGVVEKAFSLLIQDLHGVKYMLYCSAWRNEKKVKTKNMMET